MIELEDYVSVISLFVTDLVLSACQMRLVLNAPLTMVFNVMILLFFCCVAEFWLHRC